MINNDIKCQKYYSFQKKYKIQIYNNSKTININKYSNIIPNENEKEKNTMNS